ncbi:MAG: hypothetical protein A2Y28_02850 [Chlamydiae bacterium GWC2_50_10]|nr:MAG: hypothetical protein A2Z85_04650 [Chlamydiae bacterium GWA2_50_15]OGN53999.1 MAG: hypothetical protein A2098_03305 [Chlamydiae bacterium GWF2_49_8]OGN54784.1 MAG: hypothetical protein A2Y28_02850 [Chlamydiae bacterium GWC2_50_10]OGN58754.1 MAG: hypothetical protein A3D18_03970 [Chlamydiae bacterium RIFCSPHIGHO2_02_FULL_49_29]OGN64375.1 MAG: hypothetical protein A3E26_03255 [Chlamydiae bacterium RIFCSPHIGHO2_12_FULL_49_32]OGN70497.1 MAG: hypothetical protein A3I15_03085 [Chlamydiae bact
MEALDVSSSNFDIRYSEIEDTPYLKKWFSQDEILQWMPFSDREEGELALKIWTGFFRYNACLTATFEKIPCGMGILYLMPYRKVAHHCLFQLVVPPSFQKRGVGSSLIKNLKHLAKNYFQLEWMQMEVVEANPVLPILKKERFYEFARQEKFFKYEGSYAARLLWECDLKDARKE